MIQNKSSLKIRNHNITFLNEPNPELLKWGEMKIDLVIECTGRFTKRIDAEKHISSGAKRVLISAPVESPDITVVYGINHDQIKQKRQNFKWFLHY